jgi:hypothetical protein
VNLLNLPGHYHNGGIWPFIGGMWVRFIHRLGLRDVACRELLKLAQANRLGKNHDWEFNEWLHSRTGRPMGKAFPRSKIRNWTFFARSRISRNTARD